MGKGKWATPHTLGSARFERTLVLDLPQARSSEASGLACFRGFNLDCHRKEEGEAGMSFFHFETCWTVTCFLPFAINGSDSPDAFAQVALARAEDLARAEVLARAEDPLPDDQG